MKSYIFFLAFSCILLAGLGQQADSGRFAYRGYVKFLQSSSLIYGEELLTNHLIHHRMNLRYQLGDKLNLAGEVRNRLFYGEEVKRTPEYGRLIDRYDGLLDLSVRWADSRDVLLHSVIDRLYLNYSSQKWNIRMGRQRINWGINTVWNPNDLYNAYNFLDFDYEERPGSDALRIQYFNDKQSSFELAYAPGKTVDRSVIAAKWGWNMAGYDMQLLGGYYKDQYTLGMGWAGNLGSAGFKGEMGYFYDIQEKDPSLSMSGSVDYLLPNGIYILGAWLYNGKAEGSLSLSQAGLTGTELSPANLFPSKWAILAQGSGQPHPLVSINASVIYATESNLSLFLPSISYSIKENWDIDLISQNYFLTVDRRYRALGTSIFLRLKWSH